MQIDQLIQTIAIAAIPILFAITLHEAAHGYVARHFGDMTAYQQGRISLNPIRHIDHQRLGTGRGVLGGAGQAGIAIAGKLFRRAIVGNGTDRN